MSVADLPVLGIRRSVRKYWNILRVSLIERMAYRADFFLATFLALYGAFQALKPPRLGDLAGFPILINGQPIKLPVEPVLKLIAGGGSLVIAAAIFLLVAGIFFIAPLQQNVANLRYVVGNTVIWLVFLLPALTMRLLAEESRRWLWNK